MRIVLTIDQKAEVIDFMTSDYVRMFINIDGQYQMFKHMSLVSHEVVL
jgi:hypothetical protein